MVIENTVRNHQTVHKPQTEKQKQKTITDEEATTA